MKMTNRQRNILKLIQRKKSLSIAEILQLIKTKYKISKVTLNRDLRILKDLGFLITKGKARAIRYQASEENPLLKKIQVKRYFEKEPDQRKIRDNFNFEIFQFLKDLFTETEKQSLISLNNSYLENLKELPEFYIKKEFERLSIELSWKSSKIEGNTYTLLETEALIKEELEAEGHPKEEATMILNQKDAIDYIRQSSDETQYFQEVTSSKIIDLHKIISKNMGIPSGIRTRLVKITGTNYRPLGNKFQISEALNNLCVSINKLTDPFEKALLASVMTAYIQPFADGNKRCSRMLANGILMSHKICPLSYRSIDEIEYKKAVLLFYEQNNLSYFKKLFIEQFEFAVNNYFEA